MTAQELAIRDLAQAQRAYYNAQKRAGATPQELKHHEELVQLRAEIAERLGAFDNMQVAGQLSFYEEGVL